MHIDGDTGYLRVLDAETARKPRLVTIRGPEHSPSQGNGQQHRRQQGRSRAILENLNFWCLESLQPELRESVGVLWTTETRNGGRRRDLVRSLHLPTRLLDRPLDPPVT